MDRRSSSQRHELFTSALYSSLLCDITRHREPDNPITRDQLLSYLSYLPPSHRRQFIKLLMALLIKRRRLQRRSGAVSSREAQSLTPTLRMVRSTALPLERVHAVGTVVPSSAAVVPSSAAVVPSSAAVVPSSAAVVPSSAAGGAIVCKPYSGLVTTSYNIVKHCRCQAEQASSPCCSSSSSSPPCSSSSSGNVPTATIGGCVTRQATHTQSRCERPQLRQSQRHRHCPDAIPGCTTANCLPLTEAESILSLPHQRCKSNTNFFIFQNGRSDSSSISSQSSNILPPTPSTRPSSVSSLSISTLSISTPSIVTPCLFSSATVSFAGQPSTYSREYNRRTSSNPLTRIFVQAADTPAVEPSAQDSSTTPQAETQTENNGISSSNVSSCNTTTNSTTNNTDTVSSSTNSVSTNSVSTSNNPFSRSGPPQSWSDTTDYHRPVLAPSKLGGFGSSSFDKTRGTVTPDMPRGASGADKPRGASILAPSKLFGTLGTLPRILEPPTVQTQAMFKLKPSILGSAVGKGSSEEKSLLSFKDSEVTSKDTTDDVSSLDTNKTSYKQPSVREDYLSEATVTSDDAGTTKPKDNSVDTSFTSTPPQSPPHPTSMRREHKPIDSTSVTTTSSSTTAGCSASSSADGPSSKPSVFGVFAAQEKRPPASSSPNTPTGFSSNGVTSPLPAGHAVAAGSFIFGQNLQSRVVDGGTEDQSDSNGSGASVNLFSVAASTMGAVTSPVSSQAQNGGPGKSLETSSREVTEKELREKRKFDEVEVITGEETESNVLQMNCKVYGWVKGLWQERGRGILRLNDWGSGGVEMHSRLVVRTQGTFTIMLNTKIWSEMSVERASNKSVRFTASGPEGQPIIYLVMGHPKDIELLYTSMEWRVSNARQREQRENNKRPRAEGQLSSSAAAF